jgi:hypothetical protein
VDSQAPWRPFLERHKELLRQVHRRFIWQILLAYLGFARIAYEVVIALTARKSQLPHSFTVAAIMLLILGLPIVVITAYEQHGIPRAGRSDPTLQAESDGEGERRGAKVGSGPRGVRRLFTWRNAILTGVAAFTIWALVAAAWLMLAGSLLDKVNENDQENAVQVDGH